MKTPPTTFHDNAHCEVAILDFDEAHDELLARWTERIIPPGPPKRFGKSEARRRSHWAGRTALAWLLTSRGEMGFVASHRNGFLQYFDRSGNLRPDLFLNISHTESIAIAAVGPRPIGVDIESWDRDATTVLERVATRKERAFIDEQKLYVEGKEIPTGIALWSAKEAASKATGLGIKFGLREFVVDFSAREPYPVHQGVFGPLSLEQPAVSLRLHQRFLISVCSEQAVLLRGWRPRVLSVGDLGA